MKNMVKNTRGDAILLVMILIVMIGITSSVMLTISRNNQVNVSNMAKTRTAYQAASTAIEASKSEFEERSSFTVTKLNNYVSDASKKWLLSDNASNEQKNILGGNDPAKYSACILMFGMSTSSPIEGELPYNVPYIKIQGIGYGRGMVKKKSIATFQLDGLKVESNKVEDYVLYIQKDGYDFNQCMTINGDVYFGSGVRFNSNASGTIINGTLKTADRNTLTEINGQLTVNGNAYFQTPVKIQNSTLNINGNIGFKKTIELLKDVIVNGESYHKSNITGTYKIDVKNHKAYHSGSCVTTKFQNLDRLINKGTSYDIADYVTVPSKDVATTVNINVIPTSKIKEFSTLGFTNLNSENLQNAYEMFSDQLWNGFLVVEISNVVPTFYSSDVRGIFNGKVIWIVKKELSVNGNWYESGNNSSTLIYVKDGGKIWQLGWPGLFKGYINVSGTGNITYAFRANSELQGAIHQINNSEFQVNYSNRVLLNYNSEVMGEYAALNLITNSKFSKSPLSKIILVDTKIRPKLISLNM